MYGIENITAANGWAMAAVGATIVFLGLVVLSFAISQIHKILQFWEDRDIHWARFKKQKPSAGSEKTDTHARKQHYLPKVNELADTYGPLIEKLAEPFYLTQIYEIAKENDLPHPHLSINRLRQAGVLAAQEDGTFIWKKS